ncbi:hypothetical protein WH52_09885 [Tenacibaculum holothuriorum]|uniref:Uncharacterized protein n=1 Tax=Tenacibaculum holothuriorum TaxID=1635173 RepID=A0A1Y2PDB8_9FLAO|nr:DUF6095 family protein [Tenacibaculum holothuriorum]OSY87729.1 hypothetical protein WH52_09885 [Tenacibaculum holothuriorum]
MSKPKTIETGVKQILILLGLLIASPLVVSFGVKALRVYKESPENIIAYILLTLGTLLVLFTVYYGFRTFKTLLDILFNS